MSIATLNDIFFALAGHNLDRAMLYRESEQWVPISSSEIARKVAGTARGLQELGVRKGDRVAILSENRPEWTIADFAILLLGAVTVPVYATLTPEQTAYTLRDSGATVVFVSTELQLRKVQAILPQAQVQKIVIMDRIQIAGDIAVTCLPMDQVTAQGPPVLDAQTESFARSIQSDDLATIIYTSGTTGVSKGAMLTHGNMASNILCSLLGFGIQPGDSSVSFLPLSHVTARHVDLTMLYHGVTLAYCPFMEHLPQTLLEVRPTICVSVPRVYEKIYAKTEMSTRAFPKHAIYRWALSVGRANKPAILAGNTPTSATWKLANKLVFSKLREGLGGRVRTFISGGAPLGRELAEWFATVGIRIHEGYGLTETSPVIAVNTPVNHRIGTVGKILPNLEVRIAEDGEILVRGPSVFKGYWNRADETENAFLDGWFKTGDIGNVDADGFLSVTDRKKELIKTSGGKFIAPQPIENSLKLNPFVATSAIIGDRRKFAFVIVSPNFALLEDWARANDVAFASRAELIASPKVQALYEGIIEEVNRNLARFEKLKRVLLVADEFTAENGALTPTMKLRRRIIEERYRKQIDEIYTQAEGAPVA
ncbi:MAG TPA: long-chain fatty acid--CoA ligase [Candidatus Dormibacteraeota bacterium]|nr:long-chain fatty acid--CoA ligase [Candidatus Dormibacteraeota bacterium]